MGKAEAYKDSPDLTPDEESRLVNEDEPELTPVEISKMAKDAQKQEEEELKRAEGDPDSNPI